MFLVFLSNLSVGVLINFVLIKKKKCKSLQKISILPIKKKILNLLIFPYLAPAVAPSPGFCKV